MPLFIANACEVTLMTMNGGSVSDTAAATGLSVDDSDT